MEQLRDPIWAFQLDPMLPSEPGAGERSAKWSWERSGNKAGHLSPCGDNGQCLALS